MFSSRQLKWDTRFLDMATLVGSWSKDPSMKVGAVIVNGDNIHLGSGYNGFPRGVADRDDWLNDRPIKYMTVVHAELNAILNTSALLRLESNLSLYCSTGVPCPDCMKHIIQAGIRRVVFPPQFVRAATAVSGKAIDWDERANHSRNMLHMAGGELILINGYPTKG
jgi:dCMP deaminase